MPGYVGAAEISMPTAMLVIASVADVRKCGVAGAMRSTGMRMLTSSLKLLSQFFVAQYFIVTRYDVI
jgi:hypothetical protein